MQIVTYLISRYNKLYQVLFKFYLCLFVPPPQMDGGGKWTWRKKKISTVGGFPDIQIKGNGKIILCGESSIGFVNNSRKSTLGNTRPCKLLVYDNARLEFKGRVGMSNTVIVATESISIGCNVMIGGGVTIVDCDFHSRNYNDWFTVNDEKNMPSSPVTIGDNVFIGMNSIILKGVTIGNGVIIGAGSVVSSDIPDNEVWAGNPARFLKRRIIG